MFNKMADADAERSDAVICTVPDDVPSEPHANQTVVSLIDLLKTSIT